MSALSIVKDACPSIVAAYYPLYQKRILGLPVELRDELSRLASAGKVGGLPTGPGRPLADDADALKHFGIWLDYGWKLFDAASLGLRPPATRFKARGPNDPKSVIEDDDLARSVQAAFKTTLVPIARKLLSSGVELPGVSKTARDFIMRP